MSAYWCRPGVHQTPECSHTEVCSNSSGQRLKDTSDFRSVNVDTPGRKQYFVILIDVVEPRAMIGEQDDSRTGPLFIDTDNEIHDPAVQPFDGSTQPVLSR